MQQMPYHHLHPTHQYDTHSIQQPTSNIVTLHPSTTVLLSGPLASSNSSNYYSPPQQQQQQPPPLPPPQPTYSNSYTQQHYPTDKNLPAKDRHKRVRYESLFFFYLRFIMKIF